MSRPLLITDCDEVLLHMVSHFAEWLDEERRIHFALDTGQFSGALRHGGADGEVVPDEQIWIMLWDFFRTEMARQTLVPGALEALGRIGELADIVILTNLVDEAHPWRVEQLARHGIGHQVVCNQGGKGRPVRSLIDSRAPSAAAFVDDLSFHHQSVAEHAPHVWRLHMIAEPRVARVTPPAPDAHVRIDDWADACNWILDRFREAA